MSPEKENITDKEQLDPQHIEADKPSAADPLPEAKKPIRRWIIAGLIIVLVLVCTLAIFVLLHKHASAPTASNLNTKTTSPQIETRQKTNPVTIPDAINPVDPKKIPLGNGNVSTSTPKIGSIYSCQMVGGGGGGNGTGPWLNTASRTWDSTTKVAVTGSVAWPSASYRASASQGNRIITGNDLPINGQTTGIFPIQKSDKAYTYDANPNKIAAQSINLSLALEPVAAAKPGCLNMGAIGILEDGVVLFNGLDGENRDAAAYETLDSCDGHPERSSEYHHHDIPSCILAKYKTPNTSTLVGYANDGYGIYIERDKNGNLLTNANLDECHGRTSAVLWNDTYTSTYHYVATLEYPYVVGCFHGTSTVKQSSAVMGPRQGPPPQR